ncbi:hypothetical protein V6N00_04175 [Tersicoccus sp. MR15.9]|uniref:hypothetical protein n=1 Tax=Tersicoccus mangrovi TaxID=3121635 RepID=UPI002FE6857A
MSDLPGDVPMEDPTADELDPQDGRDSQPVEGDSDDPELVDDPLRDESTLMDQGFEPVDPDRPAERDI